MGIVYRVAGVNKAPSGKPARVWNIRYRARALDVGVADSTNFWCTHSHWDVSDIVLGERITLYSLTADHAYFVKTPEQVELADAHAFYYSAQFLHATQLIQIPMVEFHRVAQKIGDPQGELVFLFSTGRCGSTLLQQMLAPLHRTVSLSEPDSFTFTHVLKNRKLPETELKIIMQSVVRVESKRCGKGDRLVIKPRSQCTWEAGLISDMFPKAHFLFMYRNAIDVSFSNVRAFAHLPGVGLSFNESIPVWCRERVLSAPIRGFLAKTGAHLYPVEYLMKLPLLSLVATGWVVECLRYMELRQLGVKIDAIRYENLVLEPEVAIRAIAKYIGAEITPEIVQQSLDEMKKDSQENSSIGTLSQCHKKFTAEDRSALLELLGRKNLTPDIILPGTLNLLLA